MRKRADRRGRLALGQGAFYCATGLWPLIHLRSFMVVTGPKVDTWLVRTVGALVTASGAALLAAGRARRITPEIALLGAGQAAAFALVDTIYAARGRISKVYLADAAVEGVLVAAWLLGRPRAAARRG